MSPVPAGPIEVDARGLRCPLPVIRLAEAAREAPAGTRIVVLASDLAARYDIPAWCRMRDHELLEMTEIRQVSDLTEPHEVSDPADPADPADTSMTDVSPSGRDQPAYLRFVVLVRSVPSQASKASKAGGTGSGSERPSRAR